MLEKRIGSGLVLGKFMPLHEGHVHLLHFARMSCHRLTILVCTLERDPIPGTIRYEWMKKMFPDANVVHHSIDIPQEPSEHPDFWNIWKTTIHKHCPNEEFDAVFGSEDYGWKLAEVLSCEYIPVNRIRNLVPVSGTLIRSDPMKYWDFLPVVTRPYFVKRVSFLGPESVGKSTLTVRTAQHFKTCFVDEYGRSYLEERIRSCGYAHDEFRETDIPTIARGQMVTEDSLAHRANKLLICDTDLLTTMCWARTFFGRCPRWIEEEARRRRYDLTILLSPHGAPHVQDGTRVMTDPKLRIAFFDSMRAILEAWKRPYVVVDGPIDTRFASSVAHIESVVTAQHEPR